MNFNPDVNKSYEEFDIDTENLENEVDALCQKLEETGVSPILVDKVWELGQRSKDVLLDYQTTSAAIEEVCNEKELSLIGEMRDNLKYGYMGRYLDEDMIARFEEYCPDFVVRNPDAVILGDKDIDGAFEERLHVLLLSRNGSVCDAKNASQAMDFVKDGGLAICSAHDFGKYIDSIIKVRD